MCESYSSHYCLVKFDLIKSNDKLAFITENWPELFQTESIEKMSEGELHCALCLLEVLMDAVKKDDIRYSNREVWQLMIIRTFTENCLELSKALKEKAALEEERVGWKR